MESRLWYMTDRQTRQTDRHAVSIKYGGLHDLLALLNQQKLWNPYGVSNIPASSYGIPQLIAVDFPLCTIENEHRKFQERQPYTVQRSKLNSSSFSICNTHLKPTGKKSMSVKRFSEKTDHQCKFGNMPFKISWPIQQTIMTPGYMTFFSINLSAQILPIASGFLSTPGAANNRDSIWLLLTSIDFVACAGASNINLGKYGAIIVCACVQPV